MIKVLALREQFAHMSTVSGYDALYSHFSEEISVDSIFCDYRKRYPRGIGRLLSAAAKYTGTSGFYNAQSIEAEAKLLYRSSTQRYDTIHYTYGESYFALLGSKRTIRPSVVVTHHQPVSWWRKHERSFKKYENVSRIIALSAFDEAYINTHLPGKAVCIPHGVDVEFYRPLVNVDCGEKTNFRIVFSGRYLRDISTLAAVIKTISQKADCYKFDIVYINKNEVRQNELKEVMNLPNVNWFSDISEHKLLSLYQHADCCLVPLEDCTANNAILEAMACALPVISTDLPAIATYLDSSMSVLGRKGNADDLVEAIIMLKENPELRKTMSNNARRKAESEFNWNLVANKTADLFKSLQ